MGGDSLCEQLILCSPLFHASLTVSLCLHNYGHVLYFSYTLLSVVCVS